MADSQADVLILGGGPAGAITAAILRRYNPNLSVTLVEREPFPRYHIGESLVLEVNRVLQDAGVLDRLERESFLRKGGATFVWGENRKPWQFLFEESTGRRPHFEGMRDYTWHVDRARFDELLLDHARESGAEILQPARATKVHSSDGRVIGADIETTEGVRRIDARFVVDATGRAGVVARRFGTREFDPILRNVATFGYWEGAELEPNYSQSWDRATIAIVTTPEGWLWYIPMRRGLVSVGAVTSAERFRRADTTDLESYYVEAVRSAPEPARWLRSATLVDYPGAPRRVMVENDFNYLHSQLHGPGWALVGDAAGFVDPLFTFGVFMAATGAQLLAYVIGTLLDGRYAGATEARLLGAYEQHMRGYYDAFRAMLCVFYAFNSTKEGFWAQTRELLRGHALPDGIGDREAFMAFTFGYGVNTMLFHEATQHFGHVAMHRIRDMCLDGESGQVEMNRMGEFDRASLPLEARPRLVEPFAAAPSVVPVAGSGRVVPMTRVEFGGPADRPGEARFPRFLFLPDSLSELLLRVDGKTTVKDLMALAARGDDLRSLGRTSPDRFMEHVLRSLSAMGVLADAPDQRATK